MMTLWVADAHAVAAQRAQQHDSGDVPVHGAAGGSAAARARDVGGGDRRGAGARLLLRHLRAEQALARAAHAPPPRPPHPRPLRLPRLARARRRLQPHRSGEAEAADAELAVPRRVGVRARRVPGGGVARLLPLVRDAGGDERALPGGALRRVRVVPVAPQPQAPLLARGARAERRVRGRTGRRRHHAARRVQDGAQHAGGGRARRVARRGDGARHARLRPRRLLQGRARARALPDARRRHLLAHLRDAQAHARAARRRHLHRYRRRARRRRLRAARERRAAPRHAHVVECYRRAFRIVNSIKAHEDRIQIMSTSTLFIYYFCI